MSSPIQYPFVHLAIETLAQGRFLVDGDLIRRDFPSIVREQRLQNDGPGVEGAVPGQDLHSRFLKREREYEHIVTSYKYIQKSYECAIYESKTISIAI